MKRFLAILTLTVAFSFTSQLMAQAGGGNPPEQQSGIIVMVDDLLGAIATNPTVNPMRQIRILNSAGTVVYQDGTAEPDYQEISMANAPAGVYTVQIKLAIGWEAHSVTIQ
ncbi:MAG: hypothetical protein GC205_06655 [Bacteroidetes bacterium]|nr:hypothetical protein [Bacteroidota bacterium]